VALDVPILSIDYSLAPEFPFPRQLQEILYVYAWVQNNPSITGTTAKKILFIGMLKIEFGKV
jgi:hormone-sensitive lipase